MRSGAKWYNFKNFASRALITIKKIKHGNQINWFDLKVNLKRVTTLAERYIPKGDIIVATW